MTIPSQDLRSLASTTPMIPKPRTHWTTRVLLPLVVILATAAVLLYAARDALRPAIAVHVTPVIPKAVAVSADAGKTGGQFGAVAVQAPGWVEPDPFAISVPALAEGVVKEVLVLEGQSVTAGQVVARMIDDDVRLQIRAADAMLSERRADADQAQASIATAEAQVTVERSAVSELQDELSRKRELVKSGSVSAGEFRRLEIRTAGLEARVAAAERAVDAAKAAHRLAEASLVSAGVARDEVQLKLERLEIRSPVDGVVLARLVEPGSRISMGARSSEGASSAMAGSVLRLYDPTKLQVRIDVPLADAARVGIGTNATVSTEAVPDTTFSGVVIRAVHEANIQRNTVQFKVSIASPSPVLKPEMLMRVKLHASGTSSGETSSDSSADGAALLIATEALQGPAGAERFVWLIETGARAIVVRRRNVSIGPSGDEHFSVVVSGLRVSDRVVINPPPSLQDGARVKILVEPATPTSHSTSGH